MGGCFFILFFFQVGLRERKEKKNLLFEKEIKNVQRERGLENEFDSTALAGWNIHLSSIYKNKNNSNTTNRYDASYTLE